MVNIPTTNNVSNAVPVVITVVAFAVAFATATCNCHCKYYILHYFVLLEQGMEESCTILTGKESLYTKIPDITQSAIGLILS